jgi:hypothetical protein
MEESVMANNKARIRVRANPLASNASFKLGYFERRTSLSSNWLPKQQETSCFPTSLASFDEGWFCKDYTHKPPYHEGSPFLLMRIVPCRPSVTGVHGAGTYYRQDNLKRYVGGFQAPSGSDFGSGVSMGSTTDYWKEDSSHFPSTEGLGEEAWNRSKPRLEKAGGAVFLAEMRDLPRMLKSTAKSFHESWKSVQQAHRAYGSHWIKQPQMLPKKAADDFLNYQFGWKPFIKDLGKFHDAYRDSEQLIDRLSRENGQWVKRRFPLKEETTRVKLASGTGVKVYPMGEFAVTPPWFSSGNPARWELFEEIETSIWVSGKWRYYRPEFDRTKADYNSAMSNAGRQLTLYGFRVSPTNVYRATPWTWAADWFTNVGDYVEHVNDVLIDSIANKYLYVMQHVTKKRIFKQIMPFLNTTVSLEFSRIIETKQRQEGSSPYGFNLTVGTLTGRQMAIIGALGLSSKKSWVQ